MSDYGIVTYTLVAIILGLLFLPLLFEREPDTQPLSLLHQSYTSPTRLPNESAIYRSRETPHGFPLRTGLGIRQGYGTRNGDVRDIWNLFVQNSGRLVEILGVDKVGKSAEEAEKEIDKVGGYIQSIKGEGRKTVAVYLPNTVENLLAGFACAYYDHTFVPIPYPSPTGKIEEILKATNANVLINAAGTIDLTDFTTKTFTHAIVIVEEGSRHMEFTSQPNEATTVVTWHELPDSPSTSRPEKIDETKSHMECYIHDVKTGKDEIVSYTHTNIVAAVSSQMTALPSSERLSTEDTFLPANTLSDQYTRIMTYSAIASGSTIALHSVAGPEADLEAACDVANPTVIVASPDSLYETYKQLSGTKITPMNNFSNYLNFRALQSGRMPRNLGGNNISSKLRLIYTAENLSQGTKALSSRTLNALRLLLVTKIVYAFTFPSSVAGVVTQQHIHDYRFDKNKDGLNVAHFGSPVAGVEVKLREVDGFKIKDDGGARGEIVVRGPVVLGDVIGGERDLGVVGRWRGDGCLELVVGQ